MNHSNNNVIINDFVNFDLESCLVENLIYDFVLSINKVEGGIEIKRNKEFDSFFILGTPDIKKSILEDLKETIIAYFSPQTGKLYIKVKSTADVNFIANLIILETNFNYIKFA